jgi:hypothetical protein
MDTNAIIARIEELEDEIKSLQNELCERDVHDFEDEVREFWDGGEIHFIVCQNCGNREQNGIVEPEGEKDFTGAPCPELDCDGTYREMSAHDDWEGQLTCTGCGNRVPRWQRMFRSVQT